MRNSININKINKLFRVLCLPAHWRDGCFLYYLDMNREII